MPQVHTVRHYSIKESETTSSTVHAHSSRNLGESLRLRLRGFQRFRGHIDIGLRIIAGSDRRSDGQPEKTDFQVTIRRFEDVGSNFEIAEFG